MSELSVAEIKPTQPNNQSLSIFNDAATFAKALQMAEFLAKSTLVPKDYQSNPSNAMIAIDIANRIGASPLMVMQNLYVIHGKPSWSSSFIISAINSCGRFSPLRFVMSGEGDDTTCYAVATASNGDVIEGPKVTILMAKKEGWWSKTGSKWPTMTDLMLRYRAAAFFGRLYCPDILNGMYTADEVADFSTPEPRAAVVTSVKTNPGVPTPVLVTSQDREPGDDGLITERTNKAIEAALASLGMKWGDGMVMARVCEIIGRVIQQDEKISHLTEIEGADLLQALNRRITEKAKQPKGQQ